MIIYSVILFIHYIFELVYNFNICSKQASFFKQVNRRVGVSIILNKTTNTQEENLVQDLLQLRKILSIERTYKFLIKSFMIF
jgi:hypothetical protein